MWNTGKQDEDDAFGDLSSLESSQSSVGAPPQGPQAVAPTAVAPPSAPATPKPTGSGVTGQRTYADGTPMPENPNVYSGVSQQERQNPGSTLRVTSKTRAAMPFIFALIALAVGQVFVRSWIGTATTQSEIGQIEIEEIEIPEFDADISLDELGMGDLTAADEAALIADIKITRCELTEAKTLDTEIVVANNLDRDLALLTVIVEYDNGEGKGNTATQSLFVGGVDSGATETFSMMAPTVLTEFSGTCAVISASN